MAFIADSELTTAVKTANTHADSPLPDHWEEAIPRANRWAYNRIRGIILGRGFTAAQFAAWGEDGEEGQDWNERIGVLYAFWLPRSPTRTAARPTRTNSRTRSRN